jgi:uncharacterized SAM-binding protein YcdF (DUF218 family)
MTDYGVTLHMKAKRVLQIIFNILVLIFGIVCILYWLGMGLAVRFGQSLLWLWPVVGCACILRFILVAHSLHTGRQLPFPPRMIKLFRICLCIFLAVFIAGEVIICSGANTKAESGLDCIIVLGAKVNGTQPSGALTQRIRAAADYLRDNPDTVCIASGGQGDDEGISEAECIAMNLEELGIAPARIILEDQSTDTQSNLKNSLALLPDGCTNIGIVTNDFHIFRALCTARKLSDLHFSGVPAQSTPYGYVHYAMREFFATAHALAKGEIAIV